MAAIFYKVKLYFENALHNSIQKDFSLSPDWLEYAGSFRQFGLTKVYR